MSPTIDEHWGQILLFHDSKEYDYAIEVELTFLKGQVLDNLLYKQAGVMLRYSGEKRYYYAGLGGFSAKSFIGMVEQQKDENSIGVDSRHRANTARLNLTKRTDYELSARAQKTACM